MAEINPNSNHIQNSGQFPEQSPPIEQKKTSIFGDAFHKLFARFKKSLSDVKTGNVFLNLLKKTVDRPPSSSPSRPPEFENLHRHPESSTPTSNKSNAVFFKYSQLEVLFEKAEETEETEETQETQETQETEEDIKPIIHEPPPLNTEPSKSILKKSPSPKFSSSDPSPSPLSSAPKFEYKNKGKTIKYLRGNLTADINKEIKLLSDKTKILEGKLTDKEFNFMENELELSTLRKEKMQAINKTEQSRLQLSLEKLQVTQEKLRGELGGELTRISELRTTESLINRRESDLLRLLEGLNKLEKADDSSDKLKELQDFPSNYDDFYKSLPEELRKKYEHVLKALKEDIEKKNK